MEKTKTYTVKFSEAIIKMIEAIKIHGGYSDRKTAVEQAIREKYETISPSSKIQ